MPIQADPRLTIPGPSGPTGATGPAGPTGPTGPAGGGSVTTLLDLDATTVPAGVYGPGATFTTTDSAARTITWSVQGTNPASSITATPGVGLVLFAPGFQVVEMVARFNTLPGVLACGNLWRIWSRWDLSAPTAPVLAIAQLNAPPGQPAVASVVREWGPDRAWGPRPPGGTSNDPFWLTSEVLVLEQYAGVMTMRMGAWSGTWPTVNAARIRDSQYPDPGVGQGWLGNGGPGQDMTTGGLELGVVASSAAAQARTVRNIKIEAML